MTVFRGSKDDVLNPTLTVRKDSQNRGRVQLGQFNNAETATFAATDPNGTMLWNTDSDTAQILINGVFMNIQTA